MRFYRDEVKRLGKGHIGVIVVWIFLYFANVMAVINTGSYEIKKTSGEVPFVNFYLVWGGIHLIYYLNQKLFWIKEQGEKEFLPDKYQMVPLEIKEIYGSKIGIQLQNLGIFIVFAIAVYGIALALSGYSDLYWGNLVIDIGTMMLTMTFCILMFGLVNLWQYKKSTREF